MHAAAIILLKNEIISHHVVNNRQGTVSKELLINSRSYTSIYFFRQKIPEEKAIPYYISGLYDWGGVLSLLWKPLWCKIFQFSKGNSLFETFETQNVYSNSVFPGFRECWFGPGLAFFKLYLLLFIYCTVAFDKLRSSAFFLSADFLSGDFCFAESIISLLCILEKKPIECSIWCDKRVKELRCQSNV